MAKQAKAAVAAPQANPLYTITKKGSAYTPREVTAKSNKDCWAAIQQCLQANGGSATLAQLQAAVAAVQPNNVVYVKWAIRTCHWLAPASN